MSDIKPTDEKTETAASSPVASVEDKFYPAHKAKAGATSESPPEPRSETPAPEAGAVQTEAAPEPADTETEPTLTEPDKPKSPRSSWAEMRSARYRAEAEAKLLREQLAEHQRKAASLPAPAAANGNGTRAPADSAKPKSEDFTTYEDFLDARDAYNRKQWESDQAVKLQQTEEAKKIEAAKAQAEQQKNVFNSREKLVMAKTPDYAQHFDAFLAVAQLAPAIARAVFESEIGPDLANYLGAHPEELQRIHKLEPLKQHVAVGVLEDRLQSSEKGSSTPKVTKAPPPIGVPGGTAHAPAKDVPMWDRLYK